MTVNWAAIERVLDELIAWFQHNCTDMSQAHPGPLKRKLDYLKEMQRYEPFTDEMQEFLRQTRIWTKRLSVDRHDLIHGIMSYRGGATLEWHSQRISHEGPRARIVNRVFHNDDIQRIAEDMSNLLKFIILKVWVITGGDPSAYPVSEIKNALRELGHSQ